MHQVSRCVCKPKLVCKVGEETLSAYQLLEVCANAEPSGKNRKSPINGAASASQAAQIEWREKDKKDKK